MVRYINCRTKEGIETLDEVNSNEYRSIHTFKQVLLDLRKDYQVSGHDAYISIRSTKEWKDR